MKQTHDINVVSAIEIFDEEEMRETIDEKLTVTTILAVLVNFESGFQCDYVETVNAL